MEVLFIFSSSSHFGRCDKLFPQFGLTTSPRQPEFMIAFSEAINNIVNIHTYHLPPGKRVALFPFSFSFFKCLSSNLDFFFSPVSACSRDLLSGCHATMLLSNTHAHTSPTSLLHSSWLKRRHSLLWVGWTLIVPPTVIQPIWAGLG